MKKHLLFIGIFFFICSNHIDRYIFKIKNDYYFFLNKYSKKKIDTLVSDEKNSLLNNTIPANVLENKYHILIIHKGSDQYIGLNQIVMGEKGFIGLISKVEKNIAEVRTFWNRNNHYIVVNGKNSYGYLKSNGYYLSIKNNNGLNSFQNMDKVYLHFNDCVILFGICLKKYNKKEIIPIENITKIKKVYIKSS